MQDCDLRVRKCGPSAALKGDIGNESARTRRLFSIQHTALSTQHSALSTQLCRGGFAAERDVFDPQALTSAAQRGADGARGQLQTCPDFLA
jgi:hypothetical protein